MAASGGDVRLVFWVAALPALAAVLLVLGGVEDVAPEAAPRAWRSPIRRAELAALGAPFVALLLVAALAALARFSEAFLVLRALDAGLSATLVPIALVVMNATYAASAYPAGALSDRLGRRALLGLGFGLLALADLALAVGAGPAAVLAGVALWGLHLGLTQGLFAALVADAAPPSARGSAFGVFHLTTGAATLGASVLAGALWDRHGPGATFLAGAALATLAAIALAALRPPRAASPA
jgi:MFS family permease